MVLLFSTSKEVFVGYFPQRRLAYGNADIHGGNVAIA
jgi:hypothetical protein